MAPLWTEATLTSLRGIAEAAGAAILSVYSRADFGVQHKADHSPLTEADLLADRLILARLALVFPGTAVVSEETPAPPGTDLSAGYFLVDPLDGTKEFIARNGEFTVNIAWVSGGQALAGVVHTPALGETHWGAAGVGAWKADAAGVRPIRVADAAVARVRGPALANTNTGAGAAVGVDAGARARAVELAPTPLRVLASRSHGGAAQEALLQALAATGQPITTVQAGSSLKFCRIAEGAADVYPRLSPTAPWDTAAGQAVLEAAGGVVLALPGGHRLRVPPTPSAALNPYFVAASGPNWAHLVAQLLEQAP
jgi:3'(2'), 5'-bisphosphate nucleotidase